MESKLAGESGEARSADDTEVLSYGGGAQFPAGEWGVKGLRRRRSNRSEEESFYEDTETGTKRDKNKETVGSGRA